MTATLDDELNITKQTGWMVQSRKNLEHECEWFPKRLHCSEFAKAERSRT